MSNVTLIPKLRFSEYQGDWTSKKLGDISIMTSSKRVYLEDYVKAGIPFFRGKEITELKNNKQPSDVLFITEKRYYEFKEKYGVPQKDDILVTAVGTLGNVWKVCDNTPFYFKDGNLIWLKNIKEDSDFVEKLIQLNTNELIKTSIGSTQKALTMVELRKIKLNFPIIQEQQKIASFLTAVDKKLAQLQDKKDLLTSYKKGVMQQIFNQKLRFKPALSGVEGADNGNTYPDWEEKKLGEVTTKTSSNISANTIEENVGEYKLYGASGYLKSVDFFREKDEYISIVKDGAGVGRTLLCESESSVLGTLDIIKPKREIDLYFIYATINNINFTRYITGSTIPHIYFKDYSKEKIKVPVYEEQTKIANFLSAIDAKIAFVETQIKNTQQFKKGLLQQMFV